MKPEADYLLASLRQGATSNRPSVDWEALLLLAESHGVLPLFQRSRTEQLPAAFSNRFREQCARSLSLAHELEELLEQCEKHKIEVMPLKGPVLAELLYGDVWARPSDDLDLLVRPEEFSRARALLEELGFTPVGEVDEYHLGFERNGIFIELHFAIASPSALHFDLAGAWDHSRTVRFRGHSIRFFSPVDLILYLSLHALKHCFAKLIWVLDVVHGLEALSESEASSLLSQASTQQLKNLLLTSCEIARRSFEITLPADVDEAIQSQPELAANAAILADGILATIADPTTSVQDAGYYAQLADNCGHRWRQRLRFFKPTQQDYQWATRHRLHPKCMPLLRPFRILYKYGPSPVLRTLFPPSFDKR
jgi:Uncharacterised nucleotidyltransferase